MKATIEIPDDLYRQVKARSALGGRSVRDVTIGLYRAWLEGSPAGGADGPATPRTAAEVADAWLTAWGELGDLVERASGDGQTTRDTLTADRR